MAFPVSYDITRVGSRLFYPSPNGIHRVDSALARHFISEKFEPFRGVVFFQSFYHRVVTRKAASEVLDAVDAHLGEIDDPSLEPIYQTIRSWLSGDGKPPGGLALRIRRPIGAGKLLRWSLRNVGGLGAGAAEYLPKGTRYINASQHGLAVSGAYDWLASRPDIKPVFFIHDMLPFETPEYFPAKEFARHVNRMRNLARYGAGAVVSSEVVKSALLAHLRILGRGDMPVQVAPIPVAPVFREPSLPDHALSFHPFFIQCGTIEPRKNHLMILQVWRELVARRGSAAPKLLLAGARGWENENIVDLLDRSQALRDHVWEVSGLPTPVLKRLMGSARALLMPSFAEGFGLPVVEALAAGVPIVASDIPVFHEIAEGAFTPVGPIDGEGWRREIERLADRPRAAGAGPGPDRRERFFSTIEGFIGSL